jgi:hypothetical protein
MSLVYRENILYSIYNNAELIKPNYEIDNRSVSSIVIIVNASKRIDCSKKLHIFSLTRKANQKCATRRINILRILNDDGMFVLYEILSIIALSVKRARSTVNHNTLASPVIII